MRALLFIVMVVLFYRICELMDEAWSDTSDMSNNAAHLLLAMKRGGNLDVIRNFDCLDVFGNVRVLSDSEDRNKGSKVDHETDS